MRPRLDWVLVEPGRRREVERLLQDLARVLVFLRLERGDRVPVHLGELIDRFVRVGRGVGHGARGEREQGGERSDAKQRVDGVPHAVLASKR